MPIVSDIISKATAATDTISAGVDRAHKALSSIQGRMFNGHGVYSDPSRARDAIMRARNALDAAAKLMAVTTWPTEADYDAAEQSA